MRFLVDDVSIVEVIQLELEAKEAEREAKKVCFCFQSCDSESGID
jgi:phosphoribosylformylglycinamidine (FGAM) synthase PurS component